HKGYGFPIGGVAAFDIEKGVISPGGVGYDINCGVRILKTSLTDDEIKEKLRNLVDEIFRNVPSGVGSHGKLRLSINQVDEVGRLGAKWAVENNLGEKEDLKFMEENGCMEGADPSKVSNRAKARGAPELGTLGAGNHFLEIQKVEKIYDEEIAKKFGLFKNQIVIMVHCGSRGYGHQIADDYIKVMLSASKKYNIKLRDNELACSYINTKEAEDYLKAMKCGVNYAFCNREIITHWVRESFERLRINTKIELLYDVCHNIAKFEKHKVNNEEKILCVHRKGATRAFSAGREEVPEVYRNVGQPVIIPGSMGTASYVLIGTKKAMEESYGSVCHGAGRVMSRSEGIRSWSGEEVKRRIENAGKILRATSLRVLAEEDPRVYKDVDEVVRAVELAGLSKTIAKLIPLGIIKG
ncbi:MAG: RtcB family protein, partial [Candidatus Altarchaeaceae archaeon]